MANFINVLPDSVIKDIQKIYKNSDDIFGSMTQAGAKVVEKNIRANAPKGVRNEPKLMNKLKVSRVYKTPSDGGINTKTAFFYGNGSESGYFNNRTGAKTPIPLVLNAFEYGTKERYTKEGLHRGRIEAPTKHPFLRKSFNKAEIEKAMLNEQEKASGGLLK